MKLLRSRFEVVEPATIDEEACRDPDDLPVLGTAVAAGKRDWAWGSDSSSPSSPAC